MSKVFIEESSLTAIGNAIRGKSGKTELLSPAEMVTEISNLETGVADPILEALVVTTNGSYIPPQGVDGFNPVEVNVPTTEAKLETITILKNGTYKPKADGFSEVVVDIAIPEIELEPIKITSNGTYLPPGDGFSKVTVDIEAEAELGSITITNNGTFTPTDVDGFNEVVVNVPIGSGEIPADAVALSGNCERVFGNTYWHWFYDEYCNQITTTDITKANEMFYGFFYHDEGTVPFDLNFQADYTSIDARGIFKGCGELTAVGDIHNLNAPYGIDRMYQNCRKLRYAGDFIDCDLVSTLNEYTFPEFFQNCISLRALPEGFPTGDCRDYKLGFSSTFDYCNSLDEIKDFMVGGQTNSNMFYNTFTRCYRLKDFTFATDNGTPYVAEWSNQTLDLGERVGYGGNFGGIDMNNGIMAGDGIADAASYETNKNNPNSWSYFTKYSRFNHDSAINTINSLPDTSAYLATNGGTNVVKFNNYAGSATDGGAVGNLTEEEIAIAAAKGWTVSFVYHSV